MGFVRRVTGVSGKVNDQKRELERQRKAAEAEAQKQMRAMNESIAQAARQQALQQQRVVAQEQASAELSKPLESAVVEVGGDDATIRRRRQQYGAGYSTGVSV